MSRVQRSGLGMPRANSGRLFAVGIALAVFVATIGIGVGFGARRAAGEEVDTPTETLGATAAQTKAALDAAGVGQTPEPAETDPEVAEELPHRDLGREEALELAEGVFGVQLEEPAGIFDDLEATRFLSDNAALVTSTSLAAMSGEEGEQAGEELPPEGSVLVESSLPLRVENQEGEQEAVDLNLQEPEGPGEAIEPVNPLVEVELPAHLGEGVVLPRSAVTIRVEGAPEDQTPSDVEGGYAFYPNVAKDTDLAVSPTATGVELMTQIRSAEAPLSTTYEMSLPVGAELVMGTDGTAEVLEGERTIALVQPPRATDAAGEPVAATQRVEGDNLSVAVSPESSTQFPILLDPQITEHRDWANLHESMGAWSPTSNAPGIQPLGYARWTYVEEHNPDPAPGLDLSSAGEWGNGFPGAQAQWIYTVPRYSEDYGRYGAPPTSRIEALWAENVWFRTYGDSAFYPAMVIGLADPGSAEWWIPGSFVWYGSQGELKAFSQGPAPNYSDHATKAADFDLVTYENEVPSRHRDAYIGAASVAVVDEDAPKVLSLTAPTGWLTGWAAKSIGYSLEDTGLGVRSATARLAGESEPHVSWGADLACLGTATSPCPRVASSTESGRPGIAVIPAEMPTGRDILEVTVSDPVGHVATEDVAVMVDNTAPEITLSGPLTEQGRLGLSEAEYPLAISVTDGFEDDPPQSGVSSVEVKVDGEKIEMPNEGPWHPACATRDCAFTGNWTLKASEYSVGDHEVEVIATDAVGHRSVETLEVELGAVPPQTSFTSPHPTYVEHEVPSISFKATKAGAPVAGARFRCSLDGAAEIPATPCNSPYPLPHVDPGQWHTFRVVAVDAEGEADPTPATWRFKPGSYEAVPAGTGEKLVYPEAGKKTASYYTLEAQWGEAPEGKASEGVKGVSFQMKWPTGEKDPTDPSKELPGNFRPVPAGCVVDGHGDQVSWPLPARSHPGHSAPVYLKVRDCPAFAEAGYPEKEIQFRAVFDGGEGVAGASEAVATEFVSRYNANAVSTDATESVGPANVDLLTGAFTLSRTDVSIPVPGYEANLEFTRTYTSTIDKNLPSYSMVLGGTWQPGSPLESEYGGEAWTRVEEKEIPYHPAVYGHYCWTEHSEVVGEEEGVVFEEMVEEEAACPSNVESDCPATSCEKWLEEEEQPREVWIELFDNEGASVPFEISGNNLVAPEWAREIALRREGGAIVLAYPNGTHTTFVQPEGSTAPEGQRVFMPRFISYQANAQSMRMVYATSGKNQRLVEEISPTPAGSPGTCEENVSGERRSITTPGCRTLVFNYRESVEGHYCIYWAPSPCPQLLESISYFGPSGSGQPVTVASYSYGVETRADGHQEPVLTGETDPRSGLKESYSYLLNPFGNLLTSLTPPGQSPWEFGYDLGTEPSRGPGPKLKAVQRAGARTTIAYDVPVAGPGAPYDMSPEAIATWGESDLPVDATAIIPPNHLPAEYPPTTYTGATIHYMDPEGHEINTASPSPPGVAGDTIATTETDVHGNVTRELDPQNRLIALAATDPPVRSHELDTHSVWSPDGNEMLESWGPLHQVRLSSGETVEARQHTVTRYDEGEPTPPVGTPWAYLPTRETVAAVVPGGAGELEPRVSETRYDWKLRKPTETIVDPDGLNIRSITRYDSAGQVVETRQPEDAANGGEEGTTAGATRTVYYTAGGTGECAGNWAYANLPCKVLPAAQASGPGRHQLPLKKMLAYNYLDEPEVVSEAPADAPGEVRKTITGYDQAGRPVSTKILGGGTELARAAASTQTLYSPTLGVPTEQRFHCEAANCTGFDTQATTTTYNALGQVTGYEDADGNKAETTYDAYGRPVTATDGKGTETLHYDEESGLVTSMEVSGVGTFTAAYDADGDLTERGLPNGLTARTTYDAAGEPMKLAYTKQTSCGESCTWYEESLERSGEGRILASESSLVSDRYAYDKAGRLTESQETPTGGQCTGRAYTFDADSDRLTKTVRGPGVGGACATSGGTPQKYGYDEADRLIGPTYDAWGRITSLPAEFAGGKALTTGYFANDMVATQAQDGVTNTFQLDATGRQRQREQTGGVAGVEIFHYDGPGDSPAWTSLGSTWSRSIPGIGGELAAVQESNGTTTFKLTDLHGDVVASASSSPAATELLATSRFTEFGEPVAGTSGRFGWLGGKARRTELASGVIQMGARSYIPSLGRFLTPDPIPGGSANPYDYANQDPVNEFDLDGNCSKKSKKRCAAAAKKQKRKIKNRLTRIKRTVRQARQARQAKTRTTRGNFGGISITLPWEHQVNEIVGTIESKVSDLFGHSCQEQGETFGAIGGVSFGGRAIAKGAGTALGLKIASWFADIGEGSTAIGGVLYFLGKAGVC